MRNSLPDDLVTITLEDGRTHDYVPLNDFHAKLKEVIKVHPWFPRTIVPPPEDRRFLAVVEGKVRFVFYGKTSHVPIYGFCLVDQGAEDCELCQFEHWMELPTPPKDKP